MKEHVAYWHLYLLSYTSTELIQKVGSTQVGETDKDAVVDALKSSYSLGKKANNTEIMIKAKEEYLKFAQRHQLPLNVLQ